MDWKEAIMFASCLMAILSSPFALALYLGNKMNALSKELTEMKANKKNIEVVDEVAPK